MLQIMLSEPTLITHTKKSLYLCMYVCMYVCSDTSSTCLSCSMHVHVRISQFGKDRQRRSHVNSNYSSPKQEPNPAWSSSQSHFSTVKNLDPVRSSGHGAYGSDPPLSARTERQRVAFNLKGRRSRLKQYTSLESYNL